MNEATCVSPSHEPSPCCGTRSPGSYRRRSEESIQQHLRHRGESSQTEKAQEHSEVGPVGGIVQVLRHAVSDVLLCLTLAIYAYGHLASVTGVELVLDNLGNHHTDGRQQDEGEGNVADLGSGLH